MNVDLWTQLPRACRLVRSYGRRGGWGKQHDLNQVDSRASGILQHQTELAAGYAELRAPDISVDESAPVGRFSSIVEVGSVNRPGVHELQIAQVRVLASHADSDHVCIGVVEARVERGRLSRSDGLVGKNLRAFVPQVLR